MHAFVLPILLIGFIKSDVFSNETLSSSDELTHANSLIIKNIFSGLFFFLILITCILGNILVIISVFTYRPLQNVQNIFIVSLALADLLVSMLVMPFHIAHQMYNKWIFGTLICKFFLTLDIMLCTASILHLCAIALDRYWAIKNSIQYAQKRTFKRVLLTILVIWLLSAVISLPGLIWNVSSSSQYTNDTNDLSCDISKDKSYRFYSSFGSFFVPLFIMTFVYVRIYLETKRRLSERARMAQKLAISVANSSANKSIKSKKQTSKLNEIELKKKIANESIQKTKRISLISTTSSINETSALTKNKSTCEMEETATRNVEIKPKVEEQWMLNTHNIGHALAQRQKISLTRERRAARTLGIIMGSFTICWTPFFVIYLMESFNFAFSIHLITFITWLGYINSSLNPIIYTIFNLDFRKSFSRILFDCISCRKH